MVSTRREIWKVDFRRSALLRITIITVQISIVIIALIETQIVRSNLFLVSSFLLIIVFSTWKLSSVATRQPVSVDLIHWFFISIFFGLAPLIQYLTRGFRFPVSTENIGISILVVLGWIISYSTANFLARKRFDEFFSKDISKNNLYTSFLILRPHPTALALIILLWSVIGLFLIGFIGPYSFLTRAAFRSALEGTINLDAAGLFTLRVIRTGVLLPPLIGVAYCRYTNFSSSVFAATVIGLPVGLFVNNPTASARLWAFSILFGAAVFIGWGWIQNSIPYVLILFAGLFASQLFETFRRIRSLSGVEVTVQTLPQYLTEGHFDAFENIAWTVAYVNSEGHMLGRQLGGGFLFWIPRSLWPSKPIASGQVVYRWIDQNLAFTVTNFNVATPLPAEGYIDFGIFGVIAFACVYGIIVAGLDMRLAQTWNIQDSLAFGWIDSGTVLFAFGIGLFLVHFRGSFLSTFSILAMYTGTGVIIIISIRLLSRLFEQIGSIHP